MMSKVTTINRVLIVRRTSNGHRRRVKQGKLVRIDNQLTHILLIIIISSMLLLILTHSLEYFSFKQAGSRSTIVFPPSLVIHSFQFGVGHTKLRHQHFRLISICNKTKELTIRKIERKDSVTSVPSHRAMPNTRMITISISANRKNCSASSSSSSSSFLFRMKCLAHLGVCFVAYSLARSFACLLASIRTDEENIVRNCSRSFSPYRYEHGQETKTRRRRRRACIARPGTFSEHE